jgi:hypothetical protein
MADIRSYPFARHLRSIPTNHIVHTRRGKVVHSGAGISFFFRALNAAISEVPTAESELSVLFGARSRDFQQVTVQATITYRFADPVVAASRIDFSIDPYKGSWLGKPLEQVGTRITELAQQYAVEHIASVVLADVLGKGIPAVRDVTSTGLASDARLAETSIVVIGVRIVSIRAEAELERALEVPVREQVQQDADKATFERRALAVERERAIAENELQSKIELSKREELLVTQEGANAQKRTKDEVARQRLETTGRAETIRAIGEANSEAEQRRLAAYAGVDPAVLSALAAQSFAEHLPSIGALTITPDLITEALAKIASRPGTEAQATSAPAPAAGSSTEK